MKRYLIWLVVILFSVAYSVLGVIRHNHFQSFGYDLGLYDQALWLYSRFLSPLSTIKVPPLVILGDHFAPSYALLAPLFWLFNDVRALIVAQAVLISVSAYPVFALGKRILKNDFVSLVIAIVYLSFYGLQNALSFDVHMITLASSLLPWLFYFLDRKQFGLYWIFFFIALGFKEDVCLILFSVGIYAFLQYRYRLLAVVSMALSAGYFFLVTRVLIPAISGNFLYGSNFPTDISGVIAIFLPLDKWVTVFWSFLPFGFLPLLGWSALPMTAFHFLIHWLDPRYFGRWEMALHYRAPLAAMLAIGAIWGLKRLPKKIWGITACILLLLAAFSEVKLHLALNNLAKPQFYQEESWYQAADKLIAQIPSESSVSTQNNFISHLSHRKDVYLLWNAGKEFPLATSPCGKKGCPWLKVDDADYILVSRLPDQPANNFWGFSQSGVYQAIDNLVATGHYKLLTFDQGIYLYMKQTK